ncbi:MAG: hypothetical protein KKD44_18850 [Proteobacteria bacterium]|nr:hypothetical protein [Pseudomonadota bacterium]
MSDDSLKGLDEKTKRDTYFAGLSADEAEFLNIIKKPALSAFINNSSDVLARAAQEAQFYS